MSMKKINFNSHAHVERDALAVYGLYRNINFNSHAHVERDGVNSIKLNRLAEFQLTRSRGA